MPIFVDADACLVVGIVEKIAKKYSIPVLIHIVGNPVFEGDPRN